MLELSKFDYKSMYIFCLKMETVLREQAEVKVRRQGQLWHVGTLRSLLSGKMSVLR